MFYDFAKTVKPGRGVLEVVGNAGLFLDHVAAEVDKSYAYGVVVDVYSGKIARVGIQPVEHGMASAVCLQLAALLYDAHSDKFFHEFRDCRDAQSERFRQVGQRVVAVFHKK